MPDLIRVDFRGDPAVRCLFRFRLSFRPNTTNLDGAVCYIRRTALSSYTLAQHSMFRRCGESSKAAVRQPGLEDTYMSAGGVQGQGHGDANLRCALHTPAGPTAWAEKCQLCVSTLHVSKSEQLQLRANHNGLTFWWGKFTAG
jgi:hypothetical protein